MDKMIELKAQAYDILAKLEFHQNEVAKCQDELKSINDQIKSEFEASKAEVVEVESVN